MSVPQEVVNWIETDIPDVITQWHSQGNTLAQEDVNMELPGLAEASAPSGEVTNLGGPSTFVYLPPTQGELAPFTAQRWGDHVWNGVHAIHMGQGYEETANQNEALSLPVSLGSMVLRGERGPNSNDPQNLQEVNNLMDRIRAHQRPWEIREAAVFISRIQEFRRPTNEPHHEEALRQWQVSPFSIYTRS
jgi:hypothetical protein